MAKTVFGQFPWKIPIISNRRNTKREKNWAKMSRRGTLSLRGVHQSAGGLLGSEWAMREATVNKDSFCTRKYPDRRYSSLFQGCYWVINFYKQPCFQKCFSGCWDRMVHQPKTNHKRGRDRRFSSQRVEDRNWVSLICKLLKVSDVWKQKSHPTPTESGW